MNCLFNPTYRHIFILYSNIGYQLCDIICHYACTQFSIVIVAVVLSVDVYDMCMICESNDDV